MHGHARDGKASVSRVQAEEKVKKKKGRRRAREEDVSRPREGEGKGREREREREKDEPGREKYHPDSGVSFTIRRSSQRWIALIPFEKIIEIIERIREGASWTITVV